MKAIEDGREWIDAYVKRKGATLAGVARSLRQLMK